MDKTPSVLRRGGEFGCAHHVSCFKAGKWALSCLLGHPKACLKARCRTPSSENQHGEEGDLVHLLTPPLDSSRVRSLLQVYLLFVHCCILSPVFLPGLRGTAHLDMMSLARLCGDVIPGLGSLWLQL